MHYDIVQYWKSTGVTHGKLIFSHLAHSVEQNLTINSDPIGVCVCVCV